MAAEWMIEKMTQERRISVLVVDPSTLASDRVRTALGEDYCVRLAFTLAQALDEVLAKDTFLSNRPLRESSTAIPS